MPRKVDFHTEWAMPDPPGYEDAGNDEEKSVTSMTQASDMKEGLATQAAQAPKPQKEEKCFVAGGPAY
jgi:hypothetical protein